ncbi:MAG: hypothetical protein KDA80_16220, partial [Planctomycetaceae bacterium]|nr:hypothetical protein [Planctomycetaceae bacterium]
PLPISMTISTNPSLVFFEKGELANTFTTEFSEAPVPGEGINGGIVFDLSIEVPPIEAPRTVMGESQEQAPSVVIQQSDNAETPVALDSEAFSEETILIAEKIAPDGTIARDVDGKPFRIVLQGEAAEEMLDEIELLFKQLGDGRWRIYLKEGADGQAQLVRDVLLRGGRPGSNEAGTQDRPPTEDGTMSDEAAPLPLDENPQSSKILPDRLPTDARDAVAHVVPQDRSNPMPTTGSESLPFQEVPSDLREKSLVSDSPENEDSPGTLNAGLVVGLLSMGFWGSQATNRSDRFGSWLRSLGILLRLLR